MATKNETESIVDVNAAAGDEVSEQAASDFEVDEVEILTSLALLDLQAALAYESASQIVDLPELREHLQQFRDDHLRHVARLNPLIRELEGSPIERATKPEGLLLASLARLAALLGDTAIVMALSNQEQLTNLSYQVALELEWDEDTRAILAQNASDEERHLNWLSEQEDALSEEEELAPQA